MKILILANNDVGLFKFRAELIQELLLKNEVYISLPYGEFVSSLVGMGCKFIETPIDRRGKSIFKDLKLYRHYKKIIKTISPNVVITYTIKPNIYGGLACKKSGVEYCSNITGLGTAFQKEGLLKKLVFKLYRKALNKAKTVFFENSANMDIFVLNKLIKQEQAFLLNGAGVNLDTYSLLPYPADASKTSFLFIGRIMKEKGVDELLKACEMLFKEKQPFHLNLIGEFEEGYESKLSQCEKEGWLTYYGFQSDVIPFIKQSHCFVLPSWHEGMANTILENAACGRPVIATNIPGCKESVRNEITGFLCEKQNPISLHDAMFRFIRMSNKDRLNMGLLARKHMEEFFDKKIVVKMTKERLFQ